MITKDIYLAGAVRTAIGSFNGIYSQVSAVQLGVTAAKAALERSTVKPDQVDQVIFGNVISASLGQNVARQITIGAGIQPTANSLTINKMCGSGMIAIILAAQAVQCGDGEAILAGGTENMTRAPYLLDKARSGYKMGDGVLYDAMLRDGLLDTFTGLHMGAYGERTAGKYQMSREMQDEYAIESYKRALQAMDGGFFKDEIVPVEVKNGKNTALIAEDEEPRRFDEGKFRALRPAFDKEGTVTAGNASSINDGAAATLVLSKKKCDELGIQPQGRIVSTAVASREPEWFTCAPVDAIKKALNQAGMSPSDIDIWEINEAFSVVPMHAMNELGLERCKVNVYGGAVALGHPIGSSGTRVVATLLNAMKRREAKTGLATLCIGGGEAVAMIIERC